MTKQGTSAILCGRGVTAPRFNRRSGRLAKAMGSSPTSYPGRLYFQGLDEPARKRVCLTVANHSITDFMPKAKGISVVSCACGWHRSRDLELSLDNAKDWLLDCWLSHFCAARAPANAEG